MLIYGLHPVLEALKAGRVTRLRVADRSDARVQEALTLAGRRKVEIARVDEGSSIG